MLVQVDDTQLSALLDRGHLEHDQPLPYPQAGPGYEVVLHNDSSALLQGVQ